MDLLVLIFALKFFLTSIINKIKSKVNLNNKFSLKLSFALTVKVEQNGKALEISAEIKPSPREPLVLKEVRSTEQKFCPKCTLGLDIKHTDVLILKQYLREDGTMLPRRITKLCAVQQKNIGTMVIMSRRAG